MTPAERNEHMLKMDVIHPLRLGEAQEKFAVMVQHLLTFAHSNGYNIRLGHAMRCPDCATGKKNSLHKKKLAIDLNLFRDGVYLDKTSDHKPLGEFWESIGGSWGGRFGDGNHYSLTFGGMR
jgi:hypothetical protein